MSKKVIQNSRLAIIISAVLLALVFVGVGYSLGSKTEDTRILGKSQSRFRKGFPTATATPTPTPTTRATLTPTPTGIPKKLLWGAYVGWQTTDLPNFEKLVGKSVNLQATFVHWGNENQFPDLAPNLKGTGKTLIIFWEAMDYNVTSTNQPTFSYDRILAGDWDTYIKSFAVSAKSYGDQVILIPFEEMNGNWYSWSGTLNGNSAAKEIQAYRYLRNFFVNIPNVKFGWTVNQESVPDTTENKIEAYYPGDSYVDVIGVNGFNFGNPWQTFTEVFDNALTRLSSFNKPLYIFSMASANSTEKANWIKDALGSSIYKYPVVGWVWFNENKEKDWRVNSDANSLAAFKSILP